MKESFLQKMKRKLFIEPQSGTYQYSVREDNNQNNKFSLYNEAINFTDYLWKQKSFHAMDKFLQTSRKNGVRKEGCYPLQVFETKSVGDFDEFMELLKEEGVNIVTKKYDNTSSSSHHHLILAVQKNEKFMLEGNLYQRKDEKSKYVIRLEISYFDFSNIEAFISRLNDFTVKHKKETRHNNKMFFMQKDPDIGNVYFKKIEEMGQPLPEENYNDDVIDNFKYCVENLTNKVKTAGRLIILRGRPGTGKTNLIKCFCHHIPEPMLFIPSHFINSLLGPDMLTLLSEFRNKYSIPKKASIILVLEDCDEFLKSRSAGDSINVSSLLNLCDGLVGEALDLKFIATTNLPNMQIDPAVTRAGRLMKVIDIEELNKDKANALYKKLSGTDKDGHFNQNVTLAEVYEEAENLNNSSKDMEEKDKKPLGFL